MAIGPNRQVLMNAPGLAYQVGLATGNYDFLYTASTIKMPEYNLGDKVELPDGREFRYAFSTGACTTNLGVSFSDTGYTAYTAFATAHAVGDRSVTVPAATHAALTADALRGGYIVIFDGASTSYVQVRQIVGNTAADANAAFTAYLDAPLTDAVVSGTEACETYKNPWSAILSSVNPALPKAGVPATYVSAASKYFWVQTKGITWVSPAAGLGGGNDGLNGGFWRHDGSVDDAETSLGATVPDYSSSQYAGYCIAGSASGNGPLFVLQG